jgi:hypothetical protein
MAEKERKKKNGGADSMKHYIQSLRCNQYCKKLALTAAWHSGIASATEREDRGFDSRQGLCKVLILDTL